MLRHLFALALGLAAFASPAPAQGAALQTDIVFIVDASQSMDRYIVAVRNGVNAFAAACTANNIDARFGLATITGLNVGPQSRLRLPLTADPNALTAAMDAINTGGSVEAGLEAIRMVLGAAPQGFEQAPYSFDFRPAALINIILLTDEDSDRPYYAANQFCAAGGTPCQSNGSPQGPGSAQWPAWQAEIDATASALLARGAYLNMVHKSISGEALFQYGTSIYDVFDANGSYDPAGTFANLDPIIQPSLMGRVLGGGGLARSFQIASLGDPANDTNPANGIDDTVEELFRTKIQETLTANGAPVFTQAPAATCGTVGTPLAATIGQLLAFPVQATGPEATQTTTLTLAAGNPAGVVLQAVAGATATGQVFWTPDSTQAGLQTIRVVATDNGLPQRSTTLEVCVMVGTPAIASYCFGIGCPCGNDDAAAGCANSTGNGGRLDAIGSVSTLADDLRLVATRLPANTFGIIYAGTATTQVPFGDGFACVQPGPPGAPTGTGFLRFPVRNTGATGTLQEGPGVVAWTMAAAGGIGPILPATTWHFQAYYRNPLGPCGLGWNLTNAVSVAFE